MASSSSPTILRVGIIGCGEVAQVVHINALNALRDRFRITYLCDVSPGALNYCASKIPGPPPQTTSRTVDLCASPDVDAVLICNATPLHVDHAIEALEYGKHVLVEKPLALSYRDFDALDAAQRKSGRSVFVGYMRRYAPALRSAIEEIGNAEIQYARVRDIIGPNAYSVAQSGTFPQRFDDVLGEDAQDLADIDHAIKSQALSVEWGIPLNDTTTKFLNLLGGLGTHDLSAMREVLGMPQRVLSAGFKQNFWTATLDYGTYLLVYESGVNDVPLFDAHIEVYTKQKIVKVQYDTPYVKGLPTSMTVREKIEGPGGQPALQERQVRGTYEDSYTIELREWHDCVVSGRRPKTSVEDARQDLDLIKAIMQAADKSGAISTIPV